jgi:hypothetical protein
MEYPQKFRLPPGVNRRLQHVLDRQDEGIRLTRSERSEAEVLVNAAELLTLLKLRDERQGQSDHEP